MKLKIFGATVRVFKKHNLIEETNAEGWFMPDTNTILIDAELVGDEFMLTLLHEVGHAIFARTGLSQAGISKEVEEILVENFSVALVENFKLRLK